MLLFVVPACKKADTVDPIGPLIVSFAASADITAVYAPVTLTWETKNADMVILSDIGLVPAVGSREVNPQATTTYTLLAEGANNAKVSKSLTVTVDRTSACQGLAIPEYRHEDGVMYIKVGPNRSAFYAAQNVVVRWTLFDDRDRVLRTYEAVIAKIMPGEYGNVAIKSKTVYDHSGLDVVGCDCPLVKP